MAQSISSKTVTPKRSPFAKPNPQPDHKWQTLHQLIQLGLWMLLWLAAIDIGLNLLFPFPQDFNQSARGLENYFEYGRSIEGKLQRTVKSSVEQSAPIILAGWIDPQSWKTLPNQPQGDDNLLLSVYGMSFSDQVARALADIDGKITLRSIGGPLAPANHAYAAYLADTEANTEVRKADVAMIAVLASSVKRIGSLSGTSWTYESPAPYTYPYYSLAETGELVAVEPVIKTADQFVTAFNQKEALWQRFIAQMKAYDRAYDPLVFDANGSDRSAIIRLIRRGWANQKRTYSEKG